MCESIEVRCVVERGEVEGKGEEKTRRRAR